MYLSQSTPQHHVVVPLWKKAECMTGKAVREEKEKFIEIQSRFGTITVNLENTLFFPRGIIGMGGELHFVLSDFPAERRMGNFRLLQCLNDQSLSFVVLPLGLDNPFLAQVDLEECCRATGINPEQLLVLLIISVNRAPDFIRITANLRAPLVIDTEDKTAVQYVFPGNNYDICHVLSSTPVS